MDDSYGDFYDDLYSEEPLMAGCYTPIQACRMRISRLAADGAPAAGANNLYVTDALIQINWKSVIKTGAKIQVENGCGTVCADYQGRDSITGVDLDMTLCTADAELIELLTGFNLIVIDGENRGWAMPDSTVELDNEVGVEVWSLAWAGDEQGTDDSDLIYFRTVWPRVTWTVGDGGLGNDALRFPLVGHGKSNSAFGNGPANDFPWGAIGGPMGQFLDVTTPPEASCGYQSLAAS